MHTYSPRQGPWTYRCLCGHDNQGGSASALEHIVPDPQVIDNLHSSGPALNKGPHYGVLPSECQQDILFWTLLIIFQKIYRLQRSFAGGDLDKLLRRPFSSVPFLILIIHLSMHFKPCYIFKQIINCLWTPSAWKLEDCYVPIISLDSAPSDDGQQSENADGSFWE